MPTLPNMSIVTPTLGGDDGTWDSKINDALAVIDAHTHASGSGVKITPAALNIDADVDMNGWGITDCGRVDFTAIAALSTGANVIYVDSVTGELMWRTSGGVNVALTSGNSINTSLVGGIVGDYTSVGAEVAYDSSNFRYTFKQQGSPKTWARLASGDVRIFETGTNESVYVGMKAPAALGASYDVTWPTAVPGADAFLQISTSGVVTFSNTITQTVTVATLKFTTAMQSAIHAMEATEGTPGTHTKTSSAIGVQKAWTIAASAVKIAYPIRLPVGCRITQYVVYLEKNTSNANTVAARIYSTRTSTLGTETAQGSGSTNNANAPGFTTLSESGLTIDITAGFEYYVVFTPGAGVAPAADVLYSAELSYTKP